MVRAVAAILLYCCFTTDITGRAIAHAVSRQLPTAMARVRSHVRSLGFMVDKAALLRFSLSIFIPRTAPHSLIILTSDAYTLVTYSVVKWPS
jgi:hypothetical protein